METTSFWLLAAFWLLGFLFLFRIQRCRDSSTNTGPRPSVSVIVPARNEEKSLPTLLASLRNQSLTPDEVIVAVNQSNDRTTEVAESAGATTIECGPNPEGWLGKPWACYQGAQAAKGDLLVFLDADTCLEEGGLKRIVDTCIESDGAITVQPYHKTKRPHEQFSAFFNIVGMAGMGSFTPLGNRVKPVGLFGPCVAMGRETYFEIGGHMAVKGEVVEDLALGGRLKSEKIPIRAYGGKGTVSFRMYPNGLRELVDGWSKGFATGALKTYIPVLVATVLWIGGGISATQHAISAIASLNSRSLLLWGTGYLAYVIQIQWILIRVGAFKLYTAVLYPVALLFFLVVFIYSVFVIFVMRTVRWKGAAINLGKKSRPR